MLGRSVNVVHNRIHSLKSNVDKIPDQRKEWSLQEDKALMKYMIKEKSNGKIVLPELVSIADFHSVAKAINRNESACYSHWLTIILPILKTHSLDLPQNLVWQTE